MFLLSVKDMYSRDGKYYYCCYLDNSIGNDVADNMLFDSPVTKQEIQEFKQMKKIYF